MVVRAPAQGDLTLNHLWTEWTATESVCGCTGGPQSGWAISTCMPCLERYGAELAAAFSHLPWLATEIGMTRHAFDLTEPATTRGFVLPLCHIRPYDEQRLRADRLVPRCPRCLERLQHADA